jgi:hypothetical protein
MHGLVQTRVMRFATVLLALDEQEERLGVGDGEAAVDGEAVGLEHPNEAKRRATEATAPFIPLFYPILRGTPKYSRNPLP